MLLDEFGKDSQWSSKHNNERKEKKTRFFNLGFINDFPSTVRFPSSVIDDALK